MKAFKFFFFAVAMFFALNASAQFATASSSKSSGSNEKGTRVLIDVRFGGIDMGIKKGGFGLTFGGEKRFNDYIAWDFINIEYSAPFNSPEYWDVLSFKTGLRGFSPSFASDNLRAYTNLAVGYTCILVGERRYLYAEHAFGLTFGVGLQYKKTFSLGYTLQWENQWKTKNHFATLGFAF